jgi:glycosyltransferase involved in cell wall biosynthesis
VLWHASTEDEAQLIRRNLAGGEVATRNLPPMSGQQRTSCEAIDASGPLRIVFLSRISRMKNLDYALRVLAKTPVRILFDIWGTLEDSAHWNNCQDQIRSLPENVVARYRGVADHSEDKQEYLPVMRRLVFPPDWRRKLWACHCEAVSVGTPVLLSDQTPWRVCTDEGSAGTCHWKTETKAFLEVYRGSGASSEARKGRLASTGNGLCYRSPK